MKGGMPQGHEMPNMGHMNPEIQGIGQMNEFPQDPNPHARDMRGGMPPNNFNQMPKKREMKAMEKMQEIPKINVRVFI